MQKMEISTSHGTPTIQTLGNQGLQVRTSMQMDTPKLPIDITEVTDE